MGVAGNLQVEASVRAALHTMVEACGEVASEGPEGDELTLGQPLESVGAGFFLGGEGDSVVDELSRCRGVFVDFGY